MFDITPLTGTLGAQLSNLDLAEGWDDDVVAKIRETLRDHKVLLLRNPAGMTAHQLAEFARQFGTPETREHPEHGDFPGLPEVKVLRSDGDLQISKTGFQRSIADMDIWHTDGSVRSDTNHWISFLYAEQVPPYGRDTLFADMEAAYDGLSAPVRQLVEGLTAVHAWPGPTTAEGFTPIVHPVVLVHPETGRRSLYVNQMYTTKIVELHPDESKAVLELLFEQVHRPAVQLRVTWQPGSLAIWDNLRTQHYPVMDHPGARVMHRVMVTPNG